MGPESGARAPEQPRREVEPREQNPWLFFDRYKPTKEQADARLPQVVLTYNHVPLRDREASFMYLLKLMQRAREKEKRQAPHRSPSRREAFETPRGDVFEDFLSHEIDKEGWLGGTIVRTTLHDDWYNHVDAVMEWPGNGPDEKPVRMAIDFTIAQTLEGLQPKLDTLNEPAKIKYFRSAIEKTEEGKAKEMRLWLPKVVLGMDSAMLKKIGSDKKSIDANHPAKIILLQQARSQIGRQLQEVIARAGSVLWRKEEPSPAEVELLSGYRKAGADPLAAAELFASAPAEERSALFGHRANEEYFQNLVAIYRELDRAWATVDPKSIDAAWSALMDASFTHRTLGGSSAPTEELSKSKAA